MANPHFANLGDVWKHLLLTEVISWLQPGHYVETHAGSALYALADDLIALTGDGGIVLTARGRRRLEESE